MEPVLADLERLARQAGEILRAGYGKSHDIDYKGIIDPVTEIDHRSENFLISEIRRHFPGDGLLTEESGSLEGTDSRLWYVDPLDGTVNYAHDIPIFCVSLGYAQAGSMILGVVYDPMREECFIAEKGSGAWLNGKPLHVSAETELDKGLLVTGFPYDIRTNPENNLDLYALFSLRSQAVRRLGSAALDLCYIAAGRFDGYWEQSLNPWDLAAGGLIAAEAGAVVTDLEGNPGYLHHRQPGIIAANASIHRQMVDLIANRYSLI